MFTVKCLPVVITVNIVVGFNSSSGRICTPKKRVYKTQERH